MDEIFFFFLIGGKGRGNGEAGLQCAESNSHQQGESSNNQSTKLLRFSRWMRCNFATTFIV